CEEWTKRRWACSQFSNARPRRRAQRGVPPTTRKALRPFNKSARRSSWASRPGFDEAPSSTHRGFRRILTRCVVEALARWRNASCKKKFKLDSRLLFPTEERSLAPFARLRRAAGLNL